MPSRVFLVFTLYHIATANIVTMVSVVIFIKVGIIIGWIAGIYNQ